MIRLFCYYFLLIILIILLFYLMRIWDNERYIPYKKWLLYTKYNQLMSGWTMPLGLCFCFLTFLSAVVRVKVITVPWGLFSRFFAIQGWFNASSNEILSRGSFSRSLLTRSLASSEVYFHLRSFKVKAPSNVFCRI
jgi:hypothetical protein